MPGISEASFTYVPGTGTAFFYYPLTNVVAQAGPAASDTILLNKEQSNRLSITRASSELS